MDRPIKPYEQVRAMLVNASSAWELLMGHIRYYYVIDEKWAEGKPTHKHYNNLFIRCGSKPLITLSIRERHFIVSITLGKDEREKFDGLRETFGEAVLKEYNKAETLHYGKWLGFELHDEALIDDIIRLLHIKRKPDRKILPESFEKCGRLDIGLSREEITKCICGAV
jgi:hypothetical protein